MFEWMANTIDRDAKPVLNVCGKRFLPVVVNILSEEATLQASKFLHEFVDSNQLAEMVINLLRMLKMKETRGAGCRCCQHCQHSQNRH